MKNILVIEDSKIINNIVAKELRRFKFEVDQAHTLQAAREFLADDKYQLIVLDLHLPDGEGSELIANIQSLTKTKVVVLTSSQDEDLREELFQYGILDYIIKDRNLLYSIAEIVKIINSITTHVKDNILIIDDSKFICKQVKTILEPRNYKVTQAYTAKKGLETLYNGDFQLLILDMELPDIHGMKVLEMIRKDTRFLTLPILILSGTSTAEIIRTTLKNGASDFLKKPFVFEEFILKIDLWIDSAKKDKALKEKTAELQFINNNLEKLILEEVEKSRKKDKLLFTKSRHAQMGEMISMIAHQWRQPLNATSMAVGLINLRMQMDDCDKKKILSITEKINGYVQHLSGTVDDFRDFFKPQKETKVTNFERITNKALSLIEHAMSKDAIEVQIKIKQKEDFISYENELVQVVLNLLKNAQDALKENSITHPFIHITIENAKLSIEDNAGGIPKNILDKIFDPYFSTKKRNGTGLGLYMSKIIVEDHCHGKLSVAVKNNKTTFGIELPQEQYHEH